MRVDAATDADAAAVQYALLVSEAELQSLLRLRDAIALRARLRLRRLPIALIANLRVQTFNRGRAAAPRAALATTLCSACLRSDKQIR